MKRKNDLTYPTMCIVNVLLLCDAKIGEQYEFALLCAKRMGFGKIDTVTIAGEATMLWWKLRNK